MINAISLWAIPVILFVILTLGLIKKYLFMKNLLQESEKECII